MYSNGQNTFLYIILNYFFFIVNYYDINIIFKYYLKLWNMDQTRNHIPISALQNLLPSTFHKFCYIFFQEGIYYNSLYNQIGVIYYDDFFLFVCIFVFFSRRDMIKIIFSINNIRSNFIITRQQIMDIISLFDTPLFTPEEERTLFEDCMYDSSEEIYSIKSFCNCLDFSYQLNHILFRLQVGLIHLILGYKQYNLILNRLNYCTYKNESLSPSETCIEKLIRITTSSRPSPKHFDYGDINSKENMFETMKTEIRKKYGYSSRSCSSLKSPKSIKAKSSLDLSCDMSYTTKSIVLPMSSKSKSASFRKNKIYPASPFKNRIIKSGV